MDEAERWRSEVDETGVALTVGLLLAGVALLARVLLLLGRVALRGGRALVGVLLLAVLRAPCGEERTLSLRRRSAGL